MWGSVVCCWGSGDSGMGYLRSVVYLWSVVYLRSMVYLRSVVSEVRMLCGAMVCDVSEWYMRSDV